ncbi:MAG TPA: carboxylating nicotinate-nucleotide diphosphorylase [Xanthobacteraceae bacterium]|nr:carboxylating nicotinate-nucleotide diphosphorylase [Xanthobacteraceae bacterium]
MRSDLLAPNAFLNPLIVEDAVRRALTEDLGRAGDITSAATIPEGKNATAKLAARKPGVLAGLACAAEAFAQLDPSIEFRAKKRDGDTLKAGDVAAEIAGNARAILSAERTALNFATHLSGVATLTAAFVAKVKRTKAKIVCTRKTIPGLRALEKYAVRCGGGMNHRFGLDDAILIKDNHIAVAGGVGAALKAARASAGHLVKVEIEVENLDELAEVLNAGGADVALLDNMDTATLRRAVEIASGKLALEASGGVNLDTVAAIAETGVDMISVGALTHSAPALDLGLDVDI